MRHKTTTHHYWLIIAGITLISIMLTGVYSTSQPATAPQIKSTSQLLPNSHPNPNSKNSVPLGVPAIFPQNGNQITESELRSYVLQHGFESNASDNHQFTIVQIIQMDNSAVEIAIGGEMTGLPSTRLIWYVVLDGTFVFSGPSSVGYITYHRAFEIFDSVSGNLIMIGGSKT